MADTQRIAIVGAGAIGSAFAFHLARAGHEVTVIARAQRLATLQREVAIVTTRGERARIRVEPELPASEAFDLVLLTVLGWQIDALLPSLAANPSAAFLFAFNTYGGLERFRDAVGTERFGWAFPAIVARLLEGRLQAQVVPRVFSFLQVTTLGAMPDHTPPWIEAWRRRFSAAGIPSAVCADMPSWLDTHASFMAPLMVAGACVYRRGGIDARERAVIARGWKHAFALVRRRGHRLLPANIALLSKLPPSAHSAMLALAQHVATLRDVGANGPAEARWLLDAMISRDAKRAGEALDAPDVGSALEALRALLD